MELDHLTVQFAKDRVELLDKKKAGRKVQVKWSKCHHLVDTLRKDQSYKYILVTQRTNVSEQDILLVKNFDAKTFKRQNKWKKWTGCHYIKLIACFELDQIPVLCDTIEMYHQIYIQFNVDRIFENENVFIVLSETNEYFVLDKSTHLEKRISSIYWYWMYCFLNRLELGIENTTQIFPIGHDNVNQKVMLHMTNCTKLSLMSYTFANKTLTTIDVCTTPAEIQRLRSFIQWNIMWIPEPFLGSETNFWFKVYNTPAIDKCGYWCKDCKTTPNINQEDVQRFVLMDVF